MNKFFLAAMVIFFSIPVFAQDGFLAAPAHRGDFWVCPGAETALYSLSGVSAGGSVAAAYGNRAAIGLRVACFFDTREELDALEVDFLLRYNFMKNEPSAGPYLQLTAGPALFFDKAEKAAVPAKWGTVSAGLTFGWRFNLGKMFFAEPYIRAGYPYIAGAGASAGVRF